jgi:hypothetical protein
LFFLFSTVRAKAARIGESKLQYAPDSCVSEISWGAENAPSEFGEQCVGDFDAKTGQNQPAERLHVV